MNLTQGLFDLVAVALVAALTPIWSPSCPARAIPQVVVFLIGGIVIGPHVLGLANMANIQLLANIGLGFLFLLAGVRAGAPAAAGGTWPPRDRPAG